MSYFTTIHEGALHPEDCQTGLHLDAFWQGYLDSMLAMLTAANPPSEILMVDIQQQSQVLEAAKMVKLVM